MKYNFLEQLFGLDIWALLVIFVVLLIIWIYLLVWATRRNGLTGFLLVFFLGLIGAIIVNFLPNDSNDESKRKFRCGICLIEFKKDLQGGETIRDGKVCVFCLDKRQRGER
jgi:hypothetical protein